MLSDKDRARIEGEELERAQILRAQDEEIYRAEVRADIATRVEDEVLAASAAASRRNEAIGWGVVFLAVLILAAVYYFETR